MMRPLKGFNKVLKELKKRLKLDKKDIEKYELKRRVIKCDNCGKEINLIFFMVISIIILFMYMSYLGSLPVTTCYYEYTIGNLTDYCLGYSTEMFSNGITLYGCIEQNEYYVSNPGIVIEGKQRCITE